MPILAKLPLLFMVLGLLCSCALSSVAMAAEEGAPSEDEALESSDEGAWLHASVGLSVGDVLSLNAEFYRPGFDPVPLFSVGWFWRFDDVDVGLSLLHLPGARSSTLDAEGQPLRLGDQVGVLATLRYTFVKAHWGGFFATLQPGLGVHMTTETLRGAIALAEKVLPGEVSTLGIGFSVQSALGFVTPLGDGLHLVIESGALFTLGELSIAEQDKTYERYRFRVSAGLEWRL